MLTRVAPDLLKALVILSDTSARRSTIDREDLEPEIRKNQLAYYLQVFQRLC